jgi:hypothetical protein
VGVRSWLKNADCLGSNREYHFSVKGVAGLGFPWSFVDDAGEPAILIHGAVAEYFGQRIPCAVVLKGGTFQRTE